MQHQQSFRQTEFENVREGDRFKFESHDPAVTLVSREAAGAGEYDARVRWEGGSTSNRLVRGTTVVYLEEKPAEDEGEHSDDDSDAVEKVAYTDALGADEQLTAEERIAALIFDHAEVETSEGAAQELGRNILYEVLRLFRPDLFEDHRP